MTKRNFILSLAAVLVASLSFAQEKASPARVAKGVAGGSAITINYSSPAVKGRVIWGDLVPLGQVWRAGANEATRFTTEKDILIEGKRLPAGTYSFFIIPNEYQSTFVFNKVADQWGAFNYDAEQDQLRVNVYGGQGSNFEERLVYEVNEDGFEVRWEYGKASAKIQPAM